MKDKLDDNRPIFLQIKEQLEDSVINETIKPGERVPSTNEFASYYKINPATAAKGINELVNESILFKKRGVGMFVTENAKDILIEKRKQTFYENFIQPLKNEARKLHVSNEELVDMIKEGNINEN
ncbi:GntR family transcriptional regulator [Virgibacillus oceani]|uniref:GntR family transcriptional regulator n=1 Tax=Virgibacillus oceani TaxID=1479511 RepID=A0A917HRY1_9BACI|nr:GntR family transcriptional regulator [Virgibacillus oceani]GGG87477.1 GntR family transcriptional regulator [Virgibacillus oceani]